MKAIIDADGCIACGVCADECPEVFEMGEDVAQVHGDVTSDNLDKAKDAESSCPVSVITIED